MYAFVQKDFQNLSCCRKVYALYTNEISSKVVALRKIEVKRIHEISNKINMLPQYIYIYVYLYMKIPNKTF